MLMLRFDFELVSYGRRVPAQSNPHEREFGLDLLLDRPVHANALVLHHDRAPYDLQTFCHEQRTRENTTMQSMQRRTR